MEQTQLSKDCPSGISERTQIRNAGQARPYLQSVEQDYIRRLQIDQAERKKYVRFVPLPPYAVSS